MKITSTQLHAAVTQGILQPGQDQQLWQFLQQQQLGVAQFKTAHLLYYFGGVLAIAAMSLFMSLSHDFYGGLGLATLAACYALLGLALAEHQRGRQQPLLTGIFATFALVQTPLFVFGLLLGYGLWDNRDYQHYHQWIDARWLWMELATLLTSALALYRYRLPFLLLPVAVTLWYLGMDLAPLLLQDLDPDWQQRKWVAVGWGLLTLALAFYVDLRNRRQADFAFWLYLSGLLSFWGGLTAMDSDSEIGKAIYAAINIGLLLIGVALARRMFAVFGGFGVLIYLSHLAFDLFEDSNWFPLVLCAIGFAVIYCGVLWQRHEARWSAALQQLLPEQVQQLVARRS